MKPRTLLAALVAAASLAGGAADMPTLKWAGKDKVVNHHNDVPFRVLERTGGHGAASENMIVHGDNLAALKALLPRYEGKVSCVYIDPPYNTGNEGWVYNDNVNDPQIRKWLGEVVGREGEDFSRHDKWLCMMYPRLRLLQKLLAENGAIFISIDDNELYNLKLVCDEIFGNNCFIANISWQRTYSTRNDSKGIVSEVEHLLAYSKQPGWQPNKLPRTAEMDKKYRNPDNDVEAWKSTDALAPDSVAHQGMVYAIQNPFTGNLIYPTSGRHWAVDQKTILDSLNGWCPYELREIDDEVKRAEICGVGVEEVRKGVKAIMLARVPPESRKMAEAVLKKGPWPRYYFMNKGKGGLAKKTYLSDVGGAPPTNLWEYKDVGHTDEAKKELMAIFGGKSPFDTPKPVRLVERILKIAADKDAIVLDSFAGSGTTAHAVLKMNAEDGGNRRFILVEMMDYARTVTAERARRVIDGYGAGDKAVAGTGGGFGYYELGEPLMVGDVLNERLGVERIREYVWFTETRGGARPDAAERTAEDPYLLGVADDVAYYFCYERSRKTTLNRPLLRKLKTKAARYVVYADVCLMDAAELKRLNVVFKKIPRDISRL